jgi:hypothetical protein
MDKNNLVNIFYNVRKEYFPRWDKINLWKVIDKVPVDTLKGQCDIDKKLIRINLSRAQNNTDIEVTLCHEICHAVTDAFHGKKWESRYNRIADKAETNGRRELAQLIRSEINSYKTSGYRVTAGIVSNRIEDIIMESPGMSFNDVIKYVADENGMASDDLLRRFPTALKKAYNETKEFMKEEVRAKAIWKK